MVDIVVMKQSSVWQIRSGSVTAAEFGSHTPAIDAACDMARRLGGTVYVLGEDGGFQQAYSFPLVGSHPSCPPCPSDATTSLRPAGAGPGPQAAHNARRSAGME